jgi:hypothetical protein
MINARRRARIGFIESKIHHLIIRKMMLHRRADHEVERPRVKGQAKSISGQSWKSGAAQVS